MIFIFLFNFVPNSNKIIQKEMLTYNNILVNKDIPCHLFSCRTKTFDSARKKHSEFKYNLNSIYRLHDLIAFRFVFYNKEELLKFYHHVKQEKDIIYFHNYIEWPKDNGYKAVHFRYLIKDEKIDTLECQLYVIDNYYDALYGNSSVYKNYLT